jgi:hypothetical protein
MQAPLSALPGRTIRRRRPAPSRPAGALHWQRFTLELYWYYWAVRLRGQLCLVRALIPLARLWRRRTFYHLRWCVAHRYVLRWALRYNWGWLQLTRVRLQLLFWCEPASRPLLWAALLWPLLWAALLLQSAR